MSIDLLSGDVSSHLESSRIWSLSCQLWPVKGF
jgi:hypothetical protein